MVVASPLQWTHMVECIGQCRKHRFNIWSSKIPHAAEQLNLCATGAITTEPVLWSPGATTIEPVLWSPGAVTIEPVLWSPGATTIEPMCGNS